MGMHQLDAQDAQSVFENNPRTFSSSVNPESVLIGLKQSLHFFCSMLRRAASADIVHWQPFNVTGRNCPEGVYGVPSTGQPLHSPLLQT